MRQTALAAASLLVVFAATAGAAGPYDGEWSGDMTGGKCVCTITMIVADTVKGHFECPNAQGGFGGRIAADGSFSGRFGGKGVAIAGRFAGNSFSGSYPSSAAICGRTVSLTAKRD